jgi:hypothetical protein
MPRARLFAAWVPITAVLLGAWPAVAFHTVFDYAVERFEADGNTFGPSDGVPDLVDEFDDGSLAPLWQLAIGTAEESDGLMHLKGPGVHVTVGAVTYDVSEVQGLAKVIDGDGDFTITSRWAAIPGAGDFIHMSLLLTGGTTAPDSWEFFNLVLQHGSDGRLWIAQSYGKGYELIDGDATDVSVGMATTGPVFRIAFDDDANLATLSLSLDGGVSFMTPFPPHVLFDGPTEAIVLLGADPLQAGQRGECAIDHGGLELLDEDGDGVCDLGDNCPSTSNALQEDADGDYVGDVCDTCAGIDGGDWKRLRVEVRGMRDKIAGNEVVRLDGVFRGAVGVPAVDPAHTGVRVQLWSWSAHPVRPLEITVPAGEVDASGVGWSANAAGTRFRYDGGTEHPGGVRRMIVKQRPSGAVAVKLAVRGDFQGAGDFGDSLAVSFGDTPGACMQGRGVLRCSGLKDSVCELPPWLR